MSKCVTHHYACDCREKRFAELLEIADGLCNYAEHFRSCAVRTRRAAECDCGLHDMRARLSELEVIADRLDRIVRSHCPNSVPSRLLAAYHEKRGQGEGAEPAVCYGVEAVQGGALATIPDDWDKACGWVFRDGAWITKCGESLSFPFDPRERGIATCEGCGFPVRFEEER